MNEQFSSNDEFVPPRTISKQFGISTACLRKWAETEKIKFIRPNRMRLYHLPTVKKLFSMSDSIQTTNRKRICYARVSSSHQKEDLTRQIEYLQKNYKETEIISDIGSGLNWNRKGFNSILEQIHKGNIFEIVVAYKDRLCRFGFELFEWICQKNNTKIVVLNTNSEIVDRSKELSDDILSIITIFVAKNNGLRSHENRKRRKLIQDKEDIKNID
jgi:predicted site-specific integrase-resolvase